MELEISNPSKHLTIQKSTPRHDGTRIWLNSRNIILVTYKSNKNSPLVNNNSATPGRPSDDRSLSHNTHVQEALKVSQVSIHLYQYTYPKKMKCYWQQRKCSVIYRCSLIYSDNKSKNENYMRHHCFNWRAALSTAL